MKEEIKQKYDQVEVRYIEGVLLSLSAKWQLSKRWIREGLIKKNMLSEKQEREFLEILDKQILFQARQKEVERIHFKSL